MKFLSSLFVLLLAASTAGAQITTKTPDFKTGVRTITIKKKHVVVAKRTQRVKLITHYATSAFTAQLKRLEAAKAQAAATASVNAKAAATVVHPRYGGLSTTVVNAQDFGSIAIGQPSVQTLTYPAGGTGYTFAVTGGVNFSIQSSSCTSSQCTAQVTFTPRNPGLLMDAVSVTDSNNNIVDQTFVSGIGLGPQFGFVFGTGNVYYGFASYPTGVAVGPDGTYYVIDRSNGVVTHVVLGGNITSFHIANLCNAAGIAVDGSGTVYVADPTFNEVVAYSAAGVQTVMQTTPLNGPSFIAVDGSGALYISDSGNGRIIKLDNQNVETTVLSGLNSPQGIAVDGAGNIFFADAGNSGEIQKWTASTGSMTPVGTDLGNMGSVALDAGGSVYYTTDEVLGIINTVTGDSSTNDTDDDGPFAVAVAPTGDIFTSQARDGYFNINDASKGNFGLETQIQSTASGTLTFANNGNNALAVSGLAVSGPTFAIDPSSGCTTSTNLNPGQSCDVTVDFTPPSISNSYSDTLVATTNSLNAAGATNKFSLYGTGDGASTNTTLTLSPQSSALGANVTFTASVSAYSSSLPGPAGAVDFYDGDNQIGSGTLSAGTVSFTTNMLSAGSHTVYATYVGDTYNSSSTSYMNSVTVGIGSTSPTVNLTVSSANIALNQPETLSVTVSSGGSTPTGTVTFRDNGYTLGTGTISGSGGQATASFTTSGLTGGSHSIVVDYSGDQTYAETLSNAQTVMVAQGTSATTLTVSSTSPTTEDQVTLTANVTSGTTPAESGLVIFSDQNGTIGYVSIEANGSGGTASLTTNFSAGSHQVIANYTQDTNYSDSISASVTVIASQGTPAVSLNASAANIKAGQTEILTMQLGNSDPFGETGTVTFSDQDGVLGNGTACGCFAGNFSTLQLTSLTPGIHTITGTYNGDSNYGASTSSPQTVTVAGANALPTTTTLAVSSSTITAGQGENLTATIQGGTSPAETGTVTFSDQNGALGSANVTATSSGSTATFSLETLSVGSHQVVAVYSGDGNYSGSTSAPQTVTVSGGSSMVPTTTTLTLSSASPALGSAETFAATVSANGNAPGGSVTFADETGTLTTATLVSGDSSSTASITYNGLPFGSHQVTATYTGTSMYASSSSAAQNVNVGPANTTTTLTASPVSANAGSTVTLAGTVQSYSNPALNGVLSFADQNGSLGFSNITPNSAGGTASLVLTNLSVGVHQITAAYNNDYEHAYSISAAQTVTITPAAAATTTTTLTLPSSASYTSPVVFTLSVSAGNTPVTGGQVILCNSSSTRCVPELSLATAQITSSGTALIKFSPGAIGSHTYIAKFLGTTGFASSTSSAQTVAITGVYPSSTTITSTGAAGNYTLTGTVVGRGTSSVTPSGTVTFNDTSNSMSPLLGSAALGTGTPGFGAVQPSGSPVATGTNPYAVATGDFNGDGFSDVVLGNYGASSVSVLLGNGDGTFQPQVAYAVGGDPERVLTADFNGDGVLDLVVSNTGGNSVSILLGNGDGTFRPQVTYAVASPVGLGVMDLNHDGIADIVAGNYYSSTMSVLLGNGDGTFQTAVTYATGNTPQTLAEGDFNGDGNVDIAVGNLANNTVGIFLGNGDGTFQTQVVYAVGGGPQGVQVGDFNGDGYDDLAVSNSRDNTISVLLGNGDGTFKAQVTYPVGADPVGLVIADFNGDGKQDLSVGNTDQSALTQSILLGNGDGTFQPQLVYPVGNFPYGEAVADFNGDGYPDLAISLFSSNGAAFLLSQVTETASAALNNVSLSSGSHVVDAVYPGDTHFAQSTSSPISLTGSTLIGSATQLSVSPTSATAGSTVTFSVTVSGKVETTMEPGGMVTLTNTAVSPATTLGTITLNSNGYGLFSTTSLPAGTYSVVAMYGGDSTFASSNSTAQNLTITGSTSAVINSQTFGSVPLAGTPATSNLPYGSSAGGTGVTVTLAQGTVFKAQPVSCVNGVCSVAVTFTPTYPGLATDALTIKDANGSLLYKTFLYGTGTGPQLGYNLAYGVFNTYNGMAKSPASVAVGADGNLYVGDTATNQVYKVLPGSYGGGTALTIQGLGKPAGIAVAGDGTVYVADQTNNSVRSFNTINFVQGAVTTSALSTPSGVAVDGTGAVYIADTGHGRIIKIDDQGAETTVASGLTTPGGIALDSAGDLFYADPSNGGEITEIPIGGGSAAISVGKNLGALADIAVAPSGRVYFATTKSVSSILNGTIYSNGYFNLSGNAVNYGMALDRFQDVITTNTTGGVLAVTNRTSSSFNFGTPVGTTNTCCDSIENTGNSALTLANVVNSGMNYSLHTGGGECVAGQVLQPTQTCNVVVDFSPTAFQSYADTVTVTSNSLNVAGATNTSSLSEVGQQIPTTATLAISPGSARAGQPITFTATLAYTSTYTTPPSGMIKFLNADGSTLVSVPVTGLTTQYTTSALGVGTYNVTASYSGDGAFVASTSPAQALTIASGTTATSTTLQTVPNGFAYGGTETLTAQIVGGTSPVETGSVTFTYQSGTSMVTLGSVPVAATATGSSALYAIAAKALPAGVYHFIATYSGDANYLGSSNQGANGTVTIYQSSLTINFPAIPNHSVGDAPFTLNAVANSAYDNTASGLPVTYTVASGPATVAGNTVTITGAGLVTITATQAGNTNYTAATPVSQSFTVASVAPTLTAVSPNAGALGSGATTVTLTGANFTSSDLVQLNGTTISSTYVSATTLTTVIPASFFAQTGTGLITVVDSSTRATSGPVTFTVANAPQIVFSGPSTSASGTQPSLTFQLVNPYPVALAGTLTLSFAPTGSSGTDDPAVQFAVGGRTLPFNIPANSTVTPTVQLQTGTVAGTATITLAVTANGVVVTPANVAPVVITIPPAAPTITSTSVTRSGNTLMVSVVGFSNTRETTQAVFHFSAVSGATINNPDLTLTVTPNFATWYSSQPSVTYGSAFTYTQVFTLDQDAAIVQNVTVMLANTIGTSAAATTP